MNKKAIVATWLFETSLSNLNAGEGSSNLTEIKTYEKGLPYVSGQSVRHALRKAIKRENPEEFKCTVEFPCGNIGDCWLCDLFGYLIPESGEKRWSPIKASPALGQIKKPITTDMLLKLANDIECPQCNKKINPIGKGETKEVKKGNNLKCPECGDKFKAPYDIRQALAYKQLIENIYKVGVSIDIEALGKEEVPNIEGFGENAEINGINYNSKYDENDKERKKRVKEILKGIANISDFAAQAREMTNSTPDLILISLQGEYNQRLSSAIELDDDKNVNIDILKDVLKDVLGIDNTEIYVGLRSGIVNNENEILETLENFDRSDNIHYKKDNEKFTPREAIEATMKNLR